jgi:predicted transcriptional regulator
MSDPSQTTFAEITSEVVAAYVAQNHVQMTDLPKLIASVHEAFKSLGQPVVAGVGPEPLKPAVPIKKSITDDYLISLEDGRKLKSMKRYLATLGMTPADYRAKWGLPHDYPMVARSYAAHRSALAKSVGLGRRAVEGVAQMAIEPEAQPEAEAPKKAGRGGKKAT